MDSYPLVRARSSLALARSETRPVLLSRTYSVPSLTSYINYSDKYKPQWHSVRSYNTYTPYKYRRDYDLPLNYYQNHLFKYDDYWYDRYYYFSPLYRSSTPSWRYSYSDYLPNPYYWSPYSSYWTRYKGYWHQYETSPRVELYRRTGRLTDLGYDYDYPSYYRRSYDSAFNRYLHSTYTPYRPYLLDSLSTSLARGLSMYRAGEIDYGTLYNYWLTPNYWDKRFKDWRHLYLTYPYSSVANNIPTNFKSRAKEYFTHWDNS